MNSHQHHRVQLAPGVRNIRTTTSGNSDQMPSLPANTDSATEADTNTKTLDQQFVQQLFDQTQQSMAEYNMQRQASMDEMRQLAIEVALTVTAKLTFQSVEAVESDHKATIGSLVEQLTESLTPPLQCKLSLNAQDYDLLADQLDNFETQSPGLQFEKDARLEPGDCRIENNSETFVSNLRLKLSEVRHSLLESLHDAETERRQNQGDHRQLRRFPDRRSTA